ncbi:MAG: hypothetical protein ACE5LU_16460 [Anaerolineae bacterium]
MDQDKDVGAQKDAPEATELGATDTEDMSQPDTSARGEQGSSTDDTARATQEYIAATEERSMAPEYPGISFGDGFRFGCGFTIAGCLVWLVLSILLAAIPLVLSTFNVIGLPGS